MGRHRLGCVSLGVRLFRKGEQLAEVHGSVEHLAGE
jgi:hypothetical protein